MVYGLLQHLLLTLRLNFRSRQALVYGYLVPVFFLFAFGTIFRGQTPRLLHQMGQLLTVSVLGGACFGMPTGMVAERERGVWRRYRLLPAAVWGLVTSTMLARFFIIASAAVIQVLLAWLVYRTPFPIHPLQLCMVFVFVAFAFEGMGLVIAALADNVPAVQALGQAIFLPVIMIGGVGVPLRTLPGWAQQVAGFLPGRYAVEAIQPCFDEKAGLHDAAFLLTALFVIGISGCIAGSRLFRWDSNQRVPLASRGWAVLALLGWIAVGCVAMGTHRLTPLFLAADSSAHPATSRGAPGAAVDGVEHHPWDDITEEQINKFTFTGLPRDDGTVSPFGPVDSNLGGDEKNRLDRIAQLLDAWPPAHVNDHCQRVHNLLSAAAIADVTEDDLEGPIARAVFERLKADFDHDELVHILAWLILNPQTGTVITSAPELDFNGGVMENMIRDRDTIYALKMLGRLIGKVPDEAPATQ